MGQSAPAVTSRVRKTAGAKRGRKPSQPETANEGNVSSDIDDKKSNSKKPKLTNRQMEGKGGEVTGEVSAEGENKGEGCDKHNNGVEGPVDEV